MRDIIRLERTKPAFKSVQERLFAFECFYWGGGGGGGGGGGYCPPGAD